MLLEMEKPLGGRANGRFPVIGVVPLKGILAPQPLHLLLNYHEVSILSFFA
jgi:hypothetical protein